MRCPTLWTTWWSSKKGRQICRLSYLGGCKGELQGPSERREGRQTEMEGCNVLVTGGLGFIGSHTVVPLLKQGCNVCVMDNMFNASLKVVDRIRTLVGDESFANLRVVELDICDAEGTEKLLKESPTFDACIHFAGYKAVGESVAKPLSYYENNIGGTVNLLKAMAKGDCKSIVFSSSATVYGDPASVPVQEDFPISATNPYAARRARIRGSGGASASATAASSNVCSWLCFAPFVLPHAHPIPAMRPPLLAPPPSPQLRPHEALHRRNPARRAPLRQQLERHPAALLQPGGRAQVGQNR